MSALVEVENVSYLVVLWEYYEREAKRADQIKVAHYQPRSLSCALNVTGL
jgi:hypothetical protein